MSLSLQSYKDELSAIKKDLDQVRKLGFQIMERVPEEKRTGVERRVEEVVHEHRELEKKVRTKEEVSARAINTSGFRADNILVPRAHDPSGLRQEIESSGSNHFRHAP